VLFVVDNMDYLPTISSVHERNTRYSDQLHSLLHTGTTYSAVRTFNKLPTRIAELNDDQIFFNYSLRRHLLKLHSSWDTLYMYI
jgi:hypothetical protein